MNALCLENDTLLLMYNDQQHVMSGNLLPFAIVFPQ